MSLLKVLKDTLRGEEDQYKQYEKTITLVGTSGASKTTALGCIALACSILSARADYRDKFSYLIEEKSSGICQVPADLCMGKFPRQTPAGRIREADIVMTWKGNFGSKKTVRLPFLETAGEDIEKLMAWGKDMYDRPPTGKQADILNKTISASNAYIVAVPVSRSTLPLPANQMIPDAEPDSIHKDADLNVYRILNAIWNYKKERGAPPIEGIAVLLTKYDLIETWLKSRGMNLFYEQGAQLFLNTYFRQTMAALKNFGYDKVRFFPVFVQTQKTLLENGSYAFVKVDDPTSPSGKNLKILLDRKRNLPIFSESKYIELIKWLELLA